MWRNAGLRRRGVITTPAKLVSSDSSCEAEVTRRCVLSACNCPSSWLIWPWSSGLTVSRLSTKRR